MYTICFYKGAAKKNKHTKVNAIGLFVYAIIFPLSVLLFCLILLIYKIWAPRVSFLYCNYKGTFRVHMHSFLFLSLSALPSTLLGTNGFMSVCLLKVSI